MKSHIVFQRIEGAVVFAAATAVYFHSGFSWVAYALLLFAFDIFMAGYLFGNRTGAVVYNLGHSMSIPALLATIYVFHRSDLLLGLACLWFAHVGIDRALGYGLKRSTGFQDTHLGKIGKNT